MRTVQIQELSAYTPEGLAEKLSLDSNATKKCIEALTVRGVLKLVLSSKQKEHDIVNADDMKGKYQFSFVGLILYMDIVLLIFPKYLDEQQITKAKLQQIFRVIRKNSGRYSEIASIAEDGFLSNNRLALMLALLEMYDEYGVYTNHVKVFDQNGNGNISWERTIARHSPFVNDEAPIYFDYETVETTRDASDFVMRLHKYVLTQCSCFMQECGLSELLSLDDVLLSDEELDDFGDNSLICHRLEHERGIQFVTWKQNTIELLVRFINENESDTLFDNVASLGTTSFYNIWEKACKAALDDKVNHPINSLGFPIDQSWKPLRSNSLMEIIPHPLWRRIDRFQEKQCGDVPTLIPDAVAFWEASGEDRVFGIFDAKYYVPVLGERMAGVPGVESITKQYLYQSAYKSFISAHEFSKVINAFLVPADSSVIEKCGRVEFPGVFPKESAPFANDILLFALPGERIWQCYLDGETLTQTELGELFDISSEVMR